MKCSICGREFEPDNVQAEQYNAKCPQCKSKIRAKRNALKHKGDKAKKLKYSKPIIAVELGNVK